MAGLASAGIRLPGPEQPPAVNDDIVIELAGDGPDATQTDSSGKVIRIEHGDGSVTVSLDGRSLADNEPTTPSGWFDNLVHKIDVADLGRISEDILRGVADDLNARAEWISQRAEGMKLLGLTVELPNTQGSTDGAPVDGMSKVRHPLLLEAVLRFQANARSEMLPTDGPVKIRNDDNNAELKEDQLANALEADLNHYLTTTASEYYPDTDRMLLKFGFGGTAFKKVYFCPLRNRPVSETVAADDLIVNSDATDLRNAKRVTHRIRMRPSTVTRMQILGVYRDIPLATPNTASLDQVQRQEKAQQGIAPDAANPDDRDRELYECYCELNIPGYEHKKRGKETGLEIPYCVTVDVSTREILSVVRNYDKATAELPEARTTFAKYTFVPGFGFYDIGLLDILGNTTNAMTAAWRELLDSGMYANFPGFLYADSGARQNTNVFRIPPGGGAPVKTNGMKMTDAIMPLPYNSQAAPSLMALVENMAETGQRIGGTSELQVGEGRADAPVGTTLAMIEQATKILNSVHKRMHAAQCEEFRLLVQCFREHPDAFWQRKGASGYPWDEATFLKALDDFELTPQADPNTSSHAQRMMKFVALKQLQGANPSLYDAVAIDTAIIQGLGFSNANQFFAPADKQNEPPPQVLKGIADAQADGKRADAAMLTAQANMEKAKQAGLAGAQKQTDTPVDVLEAQTRAREVGLKAQEVGVRAHSEAEDRQSDERVAALDIAREVIAKSMDIEQAEREIPKVEAKSAASTQSRKP